MRQRAYWPVVGLIAAAVVAAACSANTAPSERAKSPTQLAPTAAVVGASGYPGARTTSVAPSGRIVMTEPDIGTSGPPTLAWTSHDVATGEATLLGDTSASLAHMGPMLEVSPDGWKVAFWTIPTDQLQSRTRPAADKMQISLAVRDLAMAGTEPMTVTTSPMWPLMGASQVWSTDGQTIWWLVPTGPAPERPEGGGVLESEGYELRRLSTGPISTDGGVQGGDTAVPIDPDSLDGRPLSLVAVDEPGRRIVVASIAEGRSTNVDQLWWLDLTTGKAVSNIPVGGSLAISPQGTYAVTTEYGADDTPGRLRLIDLGDGTVREIQGDIGEHFVGYEVWSHDGQWFGWQTGDGLRAANVDGRQGWDVPLIHSELLGLGDPQLVAMAPDAPVLMVRTGIPGQDDGAGSQWQSYTAYDLGLKSETTLRLTPHFRARVVGWFP